MVCRRLCFTNATNTRPPLPVRRLAGRPADRSNRSVITSAAAGQSPSFFVSVCSRRCRLQVLQQPAAAPAVAQARPLARSSDDGATRRGAMPPRLAPARQLQRQQQQAARAAPAAAAAVERFFDFRRRCPPRVCARRVGVSIKQGEWVPVHGGGALEGAAPAPSERSARALARARKE